MESKSEENPVVSTANAISEAGDTDVLILSGSINTEMSDRLKGACEDRNGKHTNAFVVLATWGGMPDAAYTIGRYLQRHYDRITLVVDGYCKSAGTLLALCADELVISDHGELGPLDVQLMKDDLLGDRQSGMTPSRALMALQSAAYVTFQDHYGELRQRMLMPTKVAAEVATNLTVGVFGGIYAQLDPMRIGEIDRAMDIAIAYGERLARNHQNVKGDTLGRLAVGYPSHTFSIDRQEAEELFNSVREPTDTEAEFLRKIALISRTPADKEFVDFANSMSTVGAGNQEESTNGKLDDGDDSSNSSGSERQEPQHNDPPQRIDSVEEVENRQ